MEKGHFGQYTGNARHSHTPVTKRNYRASVADDAAHIHYLKEDINYDAKHGHSDENMTADEKHISKLAGDMKYDKKHHGSPAKQMDERSGGFEDPGPPPGFESSMDENYDEEAASRRFFQAQKQAQNALSLAQRQLSGENVFNPMIKGGYGSSSLSGPRAAQIITGYSAGPEGEETVGGQGTVRFNKDAVQAKLDELQKLSITNPVGARDYISRRISGAPLGDFSGKFERDIDPLLRNAMRNK